MPFNPVYPAPPIPLLATCGNPTGLGGVSSRFAVRIYVHSVWRCLFHRRYGCGGSFFWRSSPLPHRQLRNGKRGCNSQLRHPFTAVVFWLGSSCVRFAMGRALFGMR